MAANHDAAAKAVELQLRMVGWNVVSLRDQRSLPHVARNDYETKKET
jgi:hypothetical protein